MVMGVVFAVLLLCWFADIQQINGKDSKGNWLCRTHEHCKGGCCKGFICIKYLKEGELCLIEHKWKIGCGCGAPMKCKQDWMLWRCVHENEAEQAKGELPQHQLQQKQQQHQQQQHQGQVSTKKEEERKKQIEEGSSIAESSVLLKSRDVLLEENERKNVEEGRNQNDMGIKDDQYDNRQNDFYSNTDVGRKENLNDNDLKVKENEQINAELTVRDLNGVTTKKVVHNDDLKVSEEDLGFKNVKDFKSRENLMENEDIDVRDDANIENIENEMHYGYLREGVENDENNDEKELTWNDFSHGAHLRED